VLDVLGTGAMGEVLRARDERLGREVAIKTVRNVFGDHADTFKQRFDAEARAIGALSHPAIVQVHDLGFDDTSGEPYLVMELVHRSRNAQAFADADDRAGWLRPLEGCGVAVPGAHVRSDACRGSHRRHRPRARCVAPLALASNVPSTPPDAHRCATSGRRYRGALPCTGPVAACTHLGLWVLAPACECHGQCVDDIRRDSRGTLDRGGFFGDRDVAGVPRDGFGGQLVPEPVQQDVHPTQRTLHSSSIEQPRKKLARIFRHTRPG